MSNEPCFTIEQLRKMPIANLESSGIFYQGIKSLYKKIREFVPDASVRYEYRPGTHNPSKLFIHNPCVAFERNGHTFRMTRGEYCGKFIFDIVADISDLHNISWKSVMLAKEFLTAPAYIHKLSADRLEEWITYLTAYRRKLEAIDRKNKIRKDEILDKIHKLPGVHWNQDGRSGHCHLNGLVYSFKVTDAEIEEKINISITFSLITLNTFLLLSQNNYTK